MTRQQKRARRWMSRVFRSDLPPMRRTKKAPPRHIAEALGWRYVKEPTTGAVRYVPPKMRKAA